MIEVPADELESMHTLLEAIISYIDEGVLIADAQGRVVYQNPSVGELLGMPANRPLETLEQIETLDLAEVIDNALQRSMRQRHDDAAHANLVRFHRRIKVNGVMRELEFHSCLGSASRSGLRLVIIQDRTVQRQLETMLNSASTDLVTNDPAMMEILQRVHQVAPQTASVLLQGESGTGKTHIARLIHRLSRRSHRPFIEVNCAAIPETLIESELFGHVKGAFTGASHDREGRFQAADGGTIFLDEVGEIPLHLQAKLLRAVQDHEFEPVGSDTTVKVDVRIISATNRRLRESVDSGGFRTDLYYRLAVMPLYVPSVRERPGDIPLLLKHFCYNLEARGYPDDIECTDRALRMMMDYHWPGNVRELENAVEHAVICAVDKKVLPESLPEDIREGSHGIEDRDMSRRGAANVLERREIEDALLRARGNKSLAAKFLGIDRSTLWRRMQRM